MFEGHVDLPANLFGERMIVQVFDHTDDEAEDRLESILSEVLGDNLLSDGGLARPSGAREQIVHNDHLLFGPAE